MTRHISRPSPGSEGGGPNRPHTVGIAKRATGNNEAPGAPHRNPHEPQRSAGGPSQGSGRITAPLRLPHTTGKGGEERRGARWQNEKSGRHSP